MRKKEKIKGLGRFLAFVIAMILVIQPIMSQLVLAEDIKETNTGEDPVVSETVSEPETQKGNAEDLTNQTDELELKIERIFYQNLEQIEAAELQDGVLDIRALDLDNAESIEVELGFRFQQEQANRKVKGGDTFRFEMPKEYFTMTDTLTPVAVMNRAGNDAAIETEDKIGEYVITNNVLVVTLTDTVDADLDTSEVMSDIAGRITIPVSIKKEALKSDDITSVNILVQSGIEETVLLPKAMEEMEDQKPEDQKPEDQKPEEQKPEDQKPGEQEPADNKDNTTEESGNIDIGGNTSIDNETESNKDTAIWEDVFQDELNGETTDITNESDMTYDTNKDGNPIKNIGRNVIHFFAGLFTPKSDDEKKMISKMFKNPVIGVRKAVIQLQSKKDGYTVDDTDRSIKFGFDMTLDDLYLYTKLEEHSSDPGYPKFSGDNLDAYNEKVDTYLESLSQEELAKIEYTYDLGKDIVLKNNESKYSEALILKNDLGNDEKIGVITFEKQAEGNLLATVTFDKKVFNRESVSLGHVFDLAIADEAIKGKTPVNVGWDDEKLVVRPEDYFNNDGPADPAKSDYQVEKTALDRVDTPYIDYEIHVDTKTEGKYLTDMVLEDQIPSVPGLNLTVAWVKLNNANLKKSSDGEFAIDQYVIGNDGKLKYKFFKNGDQNPTTAKFEVRLALDWESYQAFVNSKDGINAAFNNTAVLLDKDGGKEQTKSESVETEMKSQFLSKEGKAEGLNGLRYSWVLDINTQFTKLVDAYIVDTICWDDHRYDGEAGIQIYLNGKYEKTVKYQEVSGDIAYEELTKENIANVVNGKEDPFYYVYEGVDGKQYAVLIIPYNSGYQNKKVKIKYFTDLYLGKNQDGTDMSVDQWLSQDTIPARNVTNNAKFIWDRMEYGEGIGEGYFDYTVNLKKEVNTNVSLGTKEAGSYDEKTQMMQWKFAVNGYGANMADIQITDTLSETTYDLDSLSLTCDAYKRGGGVSKDPIGTDASQKKYYSLTKGTGTGELKVNLGDLTADDYYEVWLNIKVKDPSILSKQGKQAGTLNNIAKIYAAVNGHEKESELPATKDIPNSLIEKETVGEYNYDSKQINWKTMVDRNHIPIQNAVITDELPTGNEFVKLTNVTKVTKSVSGDGKDTIEKGKISGDGTVVDGAGTVTVAFDDGTKITLVAATGQDSNLYKQDTAAFTFTGGQSGAGDESSYIFEYSTEITDNKYLKDTFKTQDSIAVKNSVKLEGEIQGISIDASANADAILTIKNKKIKKNGSYMPKDGMIRWSIQFNEAHINIENMKLNEEIGGQPLEIETDTLKLYEINADGTQGDLLWSTENDVLPSGESLIVDPAKIEYTIPAKYADKAMKLVFDTALTEGAEKNDIHNSAKLTNADGTYQESGTSNGGYDGTFDIDEYVKATTKPVFQIIKTSGNNDPDTKKLPLEGAEFTLTAYKESNGSYMEAGTVYNKGGATDDKGRLSFVNLKKGFVYELEETVPPAGYETNMDKKYFMFQDGAAAGSTTTVTLGGGPKTVTLMTQGSAPDDTDMDGLDGALTIQDMPDSSMIVTFTKQDPSDTSLEGAVFKLQHVDSQGKIDNLVKEQEVTSQADGEVKFDIVDPGEYILTEISSVDPYDQGAVFKLTMRTDGTYSIAYKSGNASVSGEDTSTIIKNEYAKGTIKLKKVDDTNTNLVLEKAVFGLFEQDKTTPVQINNVNVTATSNNKGIATFENIPFHSDGYTIKEITPPDGYRDDHTNIITVTDQDMLDQLNAAGNQDGSAKKFLIDWDTNSNLAVGNERTTGSIQFTKTNNGGETANGTAQPLSGRVFNLYYNDSDKYNNWNKGFLVKEDVETDASGGLLISDIPYGNYQLKEVNPNGDIYGNYSKDFTLRGKMQTSLNEHRSNGTGDANEFEVVETDPIVNSLIKGSFTLEKKDVSTKEIIEGVKFQLTGKNAAGGEVNISLSTDREGKTTFSDIPIGENAGNTPYLLTEEPDLTRVEGYKDPVSYHVYVKSVYSGKENKAEISIVPLSTDGSEYGSPVTITGNVISVTNTPVVGKISFTKQDNKGEKLKGAEFTLYRVVNGEKIRNQSTVDEKLNPKTSVSQDDGKVLFENVEYGNYVLKETKAPMGYKSSDKEWNIRKSDLSQSLETGNDSFDYQAGASGIITNDPTKFPIEKKDQFGELVDGALLKLAGEFADGESEKNWRSGDPINYESQLIVGQTYTLTETEAPETGLYKEISPITFSVKGDGTLEIITGTSGEYHYNNNILTVIDNYYLAPVELTKTDETNGNKLEGVTFDLYQQTGGKPVLSEDIKINSHPITTDAQGKWNSETAEGTKQDENPVTGGTIGDGLSKGTYYFVEQTTLDSHVLNTEPKVFTINEDSFENSQSSLKEVEITNAPINATITLKKIDSKDAMPISDTKFRLLKGNVTVKESISTKEDGSLSLAGLDKGTYTLTETEANGSYLLGSTPFSCTFTITDACKDQALDVKSDLEGNVTPFSLSKTAGEWNENGVLNTRKTGSVSLTKLGDINGETDFLKGAVFGLYYENGDPVTRDTKNVTATTDESGKLTISDLEWAKYYLQEITAPDGYALDDVKLPFEIKYNDLHKAFSQASGGDDIMNKATEVTINKQDGNKAGLTGAVFTITGKFANSNESSRNYDMSSAASLSIFGELMAGESYTLEETKAPDGYEVAEPLTFMVSNNGDIQIGKKVMKDHTIIVLDTLIQAELKKVDTDHNDKVLTGGSYEIKPEDGSKFAGTDQSLITVTDLQGDMKEKLSGKLLADNSYVITEQIPPAGYKIAQPVTFSVDKKGMITIAKEDRDVAFTEQNETIVLRDTQNIIKINKVNEEGKGLAGAEFSLKGKFTDKTTIDGYKEDGIYWTSTADAFLLKGQLIAGETYTLKEEKAADGYQKLQNEVIVKADSKGELTITDGAPGTNSEVSLDAGNASISIKDIPTKIYLDKVSRETNTDGGLIRVNGAKLAIVENEHKDGIDTPGNSKKAAWEVGKDGETLHEVSKLSAGTYWLIEEDTPYGYITADPVKFEVKDDNTIQTENPNAVTEHEENGITYHLLTMVDQVIYGHVALSKVEKSNTQIKLPGVSFCLYKEAVTKSDGDLLITDQVVTDGSGEWKSREADTIINEETGRSLSVGLTAGTYYFKETNTLDHYVLNNAAKLGSFTIKGDGDAHNKEYDRLVIPDAVENELFETYVSIPKVDGTSGEALDSTAFTLYKENINGEWEQVGFPSVTDEKEGKAGFTITSKGTYRIRETEAAPGYQYEEEKAFTAVFTVDNTDAFQKETLVIKSDVDGRLNPDVTQKYKLTVENGNFYRGEKLSSAGLVANERTLGTLTLKKADEADGKGLDGVQFTLYQKKTSGNLFDKVKDFLTGKQYKAIDSMNWSDASNGNGELKIENLAWGSYYIQESDALSGYVLPDTKYEFSIGRLTDEVVLEVDKGTIENVRTSIFLYKYGKMMEGCADSALGVPGKDYAEPLQGAEFTIYTDPACKIPVQAVGTVLSSQAVSDADGFVEFQGLPQGNTYYIQETKVPEGYQSNQDTYVAVLGDNGEYESLSVKGGDVLNDLKVVNDLHRATISIKKVSEQDQGMVLPNSTYGLFKKTAALPNTKVRMARMPHNINSIPPTEGDGQQSQGEWTLIAKSTTDKNGMLTFEGVLANTEYRIQELKAPDGSQVSEKPIHISFKAEKTENGEISVKMDQFDSGDGTAKIDPKTGDIIWLEPSIMLGFSKKDVDGNLLAGAVLQLQDMQGNVIDEWTSTQEQYVIYADKMEGRILDKGQYQLVEVKAPNGYTLAKPVEFTVEGKLTGPNEQYIQGIDITDTVTTFKVNKIAEDTKQPLSGAKLAIYEAKVTGTPAQTSKGEILQWTTDKTVKTIEGLAAGQYVLREETSPAGYDIAKEIVFAIDENGRLMMDGKEASDNLITMVDEKAAKPSAPNTSNNDTTKVSNNSVKTGDHTPIFLYVIGLLTAGMFMVVSVRFKKKRK